MLLLIIILITIFKAYEFLFSNVGLQAKAANCIRVQNQHDRGYFMKKTMTFAIMHFAVAFTVAYLLTGSMVVGGLVALVEPAINTVAFYFHELVWKKLEDKKARESIAPTLSAF